MQLPVAHIPLVTIVRLSSPPILDSLRHFILQHLGTNCKSKKIIEPTLVDNVDIESHVLFFCLFSSEDALAFYTSHVACHVSASAKC
jgi:hypothetical protein